MDKTTHPLIITIRLRALADVGLYKVTVLDQGHIAHVTWMFLRSFSGVEGPSRTYDSITGTHSVSLKVSNGAQNK